MKFKGELHNIRLINFSVDIDEVKNLVPDSLKILQEKGKAIISMVDVQLKNMKPTIFPLLNFGYRHVAFRLLLDDSSIADEGTPKGIFFLKSFSDRPFLNFFGNLISNYKLISGKIEEYFDAVSLKQNKNYVEYALDPYSSVETDSQLFQSIKRIDRAYATSKGSTYVTKITRKGWPIEPIKCYHFATNYFKSATLLGAFKVNGVINYTWNNPIRIKF